MKKIISFFMVLFFLSLNLASYDYPFENQKYLFNAYFAPIKGIEPRWKMEFQKGELLLDIPKVPVEVFDPEVGIFTDYTLKEKYSLSKYKDFLFLSTSNKNYMLLYYEDKFCILVDTEKIGSLFGGNINSAYISTSGNVTLFSPSPNYIKYSSALEENVAGEHIVYNGWSECYLQLGVPWCPAGGNNGIGEWLETEAFTNTDEFIIVNGFVRADKPDWYYNNARIKTAFIDTEQGSWFITLKDTPHPQIIKLPKKVSGRIRLTIDDVYEGEKYKDVCLAGFYMLYKTPEKR